MNLIENALPGEWIYALGWTVLHSLWQAAGIALVVGLLLLQMHKRPAWQRYWLAHLGWVSILLCSVFTFSHYYQPLEPLSTSAITPLTSTGETALMASSSTLEAYLQVLGDYFNRHLPLIVSLWTVGMFVFLLRFLGGLLYLQRLRSHRTRGLGEHWEGQLTEIKERLGIRRSVQLLESALVKVPVVIGWIKPVILFPMGAINALSPEQVAAVLAHELAHIRRHDYLLNLIRSLVEVLFYFNPAVWWLSGRIRIEREHCCDDLALGVCGDALSYVRALVALQEWSRQPGLDLAMTFSRSKPELLHRVQRILNQPIDKSHPMEKLVITCLLCLVLGFTLVSAALPDDGAKKKPSSELSTTATARISPAADQSSTLSLTLEDLLLQETKEQSVLDTVPKDVSRIRWTNEGTSYDVTIENKRINRLSIDGKEVPEQDLINYYDLVQEQLDNLPEPPAPPVPPAPPSPANPAASVSAPAPPMPPSPPALKKAPSSAPPTPPAPPRPSELPPAPPAPPSAPRIKLEKPLKGERGSGQSYFFRPEEPEQQLDVAVWQTDGTGLVNPQIHILTNGHRLQADKVVLVRVDTDERPDLEGQVIVELKADNHASAVGANSAATSTVHTNAIFVSRNTASADAGEQVTIEESLIGDQLIRPEEPYHIELTRDALLINGQKQSREKHEKYLRLWEQSIDRPVEKDDVYFYNRRSKRIME